MPRLPIKAPFPSSTHAVSDRDLISACLKGQSSAWDSLIGRYVGLMISTCLRMGLSSADSEDIVQDVCVILLDHLGDLKDTSKLSSWLISTTKREAWRFQRRKGMTLASELGDGEWEMESATGIHTQSANSPETEFLAVEEQQIVRTGLERLPEKCRRLLTLLYCVETPASYAEIAAEFSIPTGSIGPTRARCLQHLRKTLSELGF